MRRGSLSARPRTRIARKQSEWLSPLLSPAIAVVAAPPMWRPVQDGAADEAVVGAVSAPLGAAAREPSDEDFPRPEWVAVRALLGCAFNLPHPPIFAHLFDGGAIVRGCLREAGTRAEGHPEGSWGVPHSRPESISHCWYSASHRAMSHSSSSMPGSTPAGEARFHRDDETPPPSEGWGLRCAAVVRPR